jgi:hypothetical protein
MASLREKVQFRMNQPVKVALAYEDGVFKQDDRFGDYWMYTLEDERIMFVPPVVHEQIKQRRIESGQTFTITKVSARCGHRRGLDWVVDVVGNEEHRPSEQTPDALVVAKDAGEKKSADQPADCDQSQTDSAGAAGSGGEGSGEQSPVEATQSHAVEQASSEIVGSEAKDGSGSKPNGRVQPGVVNGAAGNRAKPNTAGGNGVAKPNGDQPAIKLRTSPLFKAAMQAAIDAMIEGEQYASERNYSVRFTSEDLRATAISIFISMRDGGYR